MDGYKHFVRTDISGIVILAFSDAFVTPEETDILVESDAGRHYNPILTNERGQYIFKIVNGSMVARTQQELDVEWDARPPEPKSEIEQVKSQLADANLQIIDLFEELLTKGVL